MLCAERPVILGSIPIDNVALEIGGVATQGSDLQLVEILHCEGEQHEINSVLVELDSQSISSEVIDIDQDLQNFDDNIEISEEQLLAESEATTSSK